MGLVGATGRGVSPCLLKRPVPLRRRGAEFGVDWVTVRYAQNCTLRTAYFEVGFAPTTKARSLIEA